MVHFGICCVLTVPGIVGFDARSKIKKYSPSNLHAELGTFFTRVPHYCATMPDYSVFLDLGNKVVQIFRPQNIHANFCTRGLHCSITVPVLPDSKYTFYTLYYRVS